MPTPAPTRPPFLCYQRLRRIAVAVLLAECVVGMLGSLTPRREIFPFASWFLFLLVPHHTNDYDLVLHSNQGVAIEPPLPYNQLPWLVSSPHSIVTYNLVQQFGDAVARHDAARSRNLRRQVDTMFMQPRVQYDLVRNTYQPVERYETGRVRTRQTLASFTSGEP